jgi:hypothetical protein
MAFILAGDLGELNTREDFERQKQKWREYREYLDSIRSVMPQSAYEFATAPWHYDNSDSRSLHDSWVDSLLINELASGARHEIRLLEMKVQLRGPYHNGSTMLEHREVYSYSLGMPFSSSPGRRRLGHGDWLCDEVRLSDGGHVLHEIEFSTGCRWIIECTDVEWRWKPALAKARWVGVVPKNSVRRYATSFSSQYS